MDAHIDERPPLRRGFRVVVPIVLHRPRHVDGEPHGHGRYDGYGGSLALVLIARIWPISLVRLSSARPHSEEGADLRNNDWSIARAGTTLSLRRRSASRRRIR